MYYKIRLTGQTESWGYGLPTSDFIHFLGNGVFALRPGASLSDIENSTIEIVALNDSEISIIKERCSLPDDWTPDAVPTEE